MKPTPQHQSFNVAAEIVRAKDHLSVDHFDAWGVREVSVKIAAVVIEEVTSPAGKKNTKPVMYFEPSANGNACAPLAINATNTRRMKAIAGSTKSDDWVGVVITLNIEQGKLYGGGEGDTIRIKVDANEGRV